MVLKIVKKPVEDVESFEQVNVQNLSEYAAEIVALGEMQDKINSIDEAIRKKFAKELDVQAELNKELTKRLKVLRTNLDEHYKKSDPDKEYTENAGTHAVTIGAAGNQRKITDMQLVRELMADDTAFFGLAKMDLKDIDAYLTPAEREEVLETTRTQRPIAITQVVRVKV